MKKFIFLLTPVIFIFTGCSSSDDDNGGGNGRAPISLSIDEIRLNSGEARQQQVSVTANAGWNISLRPQSAGSWISVSPSSGNAGTTTVTVSIAENTSDADRTAEILFTTSNGGSDRIEVSQPRAPFFIDVNDNEHTVNWSGGNIEVIVSYNTDSYTVSFTPGSAETWITETNRTGGNGVDRLTFAISEYNSPTAREGSIVFSNGMVSETVRVIQSGRPGQGAFADGDYMLFQRASVGTGVNIIIMGDGYTENEINTQRIYERDMRAAMEDFFSVYPYSAYRNYFNVWMVVGVSNQSGPSVGNTTRDTRFGAWITGDGTEIELRNENLVTSYATSIPGIPQNEGELTVMLILNSTRYAGTSILYSSGYSISMCPRIESSSRNTDARAVVIHECGGHGFGQLADEYVYGGTIPADEQADIRRWQTSVEAFMNVDFTTNQNQVLWSNFFNYPKYTTNFVGFRIGIYEGALTYASGVYRPEQNSCMNNNIDYFNAPSRYEIVRRIMSLSGINANYPVGEFVNQDNPSAPSYTRASMPVIYKGQGFGRPILRN